MAEYLTLGIFALSLFTCILTGKAVIYALLFGYILFFSYGIWKGLKVRNLISLTINGVKTVKNILITFVLIGMITALWRASGTISFIVCCALKIFTPSAFILISYLLCCVVSFLTGTSFGTAATIGIICMTMGNGMGIHPALLGGAILSGIFFGDRCSPMSTSALLISELTKTDIYENIKLMFRTSIVPVLLSCIVYGIMGITAGNVSAINSLDMGTLFAENFSLHPITALPAVIILVLSFFKVNVKITMAASICASWLLAFLVQGESPLALFQIMIKGYQPHNQQLAKLLTGGGILSMVNVFAIVCVSSTYAGIFQGTGILNGLKHHLARLSRLVQPYGSILVTSILTNMISCNQTLSTMLTYQLCKDLMPEQQELAIDMENTVIIIAPLVPWSIAGAVPLATLSAPTTALLAACYLYLLPIWNYVWYLYRKHAVCAD